MDFEDGTPVLSGRESERTEVRVLDSRGAREKVRTARMKAAVRRKAESEEMKRSVQFRKERTEPAASSPSAVSSKTQNDTAASGRKPAD